MKNIIEKIKNGEIKMKPKWHFVLKTLLVVLGAVFLSLFGLFLMSLIFFVLHASGAWYLPGFGFRGLGLFLFSLPWVLLLLALLLVATLEILARRFSFVYKKPILYSVLGIILFVFVGGILINKTSVHPALFMRAEEGRLPIMNHMYEDFGMPMHEDVYGGVVSETTEGGLVLIDRNGETVDVIVSSEHELSGEGDINAGDTVIILGKEKEGKVEADGIKVIKGDKMPFFMEKRGPRHMPGMLMPPPAKGRM